MKPVGIMLLCLTLSSCAQIRSSHSDPIDALAQELNASNGLWINGLYPDISLPPDATPEDVLAQAAKMSGFDQGHIKTYHIREVRQVQLNTGQMENYSAALVESDLGTKILLFKHEGNNRWWTRFYAVPHDQHNDRPDARQ
jgi:hypothetical protein